MHAPTVEMDAMDKLNLTYRTRGGGEGMGGDGAEKNMPLACCCPPCEVYRADGMDCPAMPLACCCGWLYTMICWKPKGLNSK